MAAADASRLLAQATLGASRTDIARAEAIGARKWIEEQFEAEPLQGHYDWMMDSGYGVEDNRYGTAGLDNSLWRKFIASPDALRQRMVLALSELLVVSVTGIDAEWRQFAVANYLVANNGPDDVGQGRLLPTTSVEQLAATLANWLGVSAGDQLTLLPNLANFSTRNLGFMA